MKTHFKIIIVCSLFFALLCIAFIAFANYHIEKKAKNYVYANIESLPVCNVGLVLGTAKVLKNGKTNQYFQYRIEAAALLYKNRKVKHFIVSGDNHVKGYDEPEDMRQALMAVGVPDSCITLDYAGFRTLDSIIRCWKVFGQTQYTIISQQFHNERAVFLAKNYGLQVCAYNAQGVSKSYGFRTHLREYVARAKAVIDVYITKKEPKFLGSPIQIKF